MADTDQEQGTYSDKETADLRWLPKLTKRAAVLIYRLGTRESGMPKS